MREKFIISIICGICIWLTSWITAYFVPIGAPILIASMGASCMILFVTPSSSMAQPWPFLAGHIVSALVGLEIHQHVTDAIVAAPIALGISILLMFLLRCLHPPGAATALIPLLSSDWVVNNSVQFLWQPLATNLAIILCCSVLINRLILNHQYPLFHTSKDLKPDRTSSVNGQSNPSSLALEQAMADSHLLLDLGIDQLSTIISNLQLENFQKDFGDLTCKAIMAPITHTVEYDTSVETAWHLMLANQLAVLPVLDKKQRLIGIITTWDFLKNIELTSYHTLEKNWLSFLKPSRGLQTDKPEYVGHIMTKKVTSLFENAPVKHLIPLMISHTYRQIPIVEENGRLVGMVNPQQIIANLFHYPS